MAEQYKNLWIHLAGNPPGVKHKEPPFWRYRLGPDGDERFMDTWEIHGLATTKNNTQGYELGASFLLWYAVFGDIEITKRGPKNHASITLHDPLESREFQSFTSVREYPESEVRIFGAPDQVVTGSPLHWRCEVQGTIVPIREWHIKGQLLAANHGPGEDIANEDALKRLYLRFTGATFQIDEQQRARVLL